MIHTDYVFLVHNWIQHASAEFHGRQCLCYHVCRVSQCADLLDVFAFEYGMAHFREVHIRKDGAVHVEEKLASPEDILLHTPIARGWYLLPSFLLKKLATSVTALVEKSDFHDNHYGFSLPISAEALYSIFRTGGHFQYFQKESRNRSLVNLVNCIMFNYIGKMFKNVLLLHLLISY